MNTFRIWGLYKNDRSGNYDELCTTVQSKHIENAISAFRQMEGNLNVTITKIDRL